MNIQTAIRPDREERQRTAREPAHAAAERKGRLDSPHRAEAGQAP